MALRGNLKDFSLPDVFQLVTFSKKTGVLRIARVDGAEGSVWFRDGDVFFAQSTWKREPLGERLVTAQKITPSALTRALELRAAESDGGRRLGRILVDEGYITEPVLEAFVQEQIQDTIFDLMRWDEGTFDFEVLPDAVEEDIGLAVSIENVVMEGARRLEEWNRIRKKIPSMEIVFKMSTAPGEGTFEISLKPIEWNLLLLVDGTRSVADLARETGRTDFEVARIIYGLFSAGLLEFAGDEEVERLRVERAAREARFARVEPTVPPSPETSPEQEAPASSAEAPVRSEPSEIPEFLGTRVTIERDVEVFEEVLGAVLQTPPTVRPAQPETERFPPVVTPEVQAPAEPAPAERPSHDRPPTEPVSVEPSGPSESEEPGTFVVVPEAPLGEVSVPPAVEEPEPPAAEEPVAPTAEERAVPPAEEPVAPTTEKPSAPDEEILEAATAESVQPVVVETEREPAQVAPPEETLVPQVEGAAEEAIPQVESPERQVVDAEEPEGGAEAPVPQAEVSVEEAESADALAQADAQTADSAIDESPAGAALSSESEVVLSAELEVSVSSEVEQVLSIRETEELAAVEEGESPSAPADEFAEEFAAEVEDEPEATPAAEQEATVLAESESLVTEEPEAAEELETPEGQEVAEESDVVEEQAAVEEMEFAAAPDVIEVLEAPEEGESPRKPERSAAEPALEAAVAPMSERAEAEAELVAEDDAGPAEPEERDESGRVISTEAYMADLTITEIGFSGGLGDELSALTGASRPTGKPAATVNGIPPADGDSLTRDRRIDRDTIQKIIDGIQGL